MQDLWDWAQPPGFRRRTRFICRTQRFATGVFRAPRSCSNVVTNMQESSAVEVMGRVHGTLVHRRRVAVLAKYLSAMIEPGSSVLDIGCGDGKLDCLLVEKVEGMRIEGAEIQPRADCAITCRAFDGVHLPFADESFDGCMFVDVLHHAPDAAAILREARRVSKKFILIKDHLAESALAHFRLRVMDWVGNRAHGVALPYNYLSIKQ
jgi:SAM-dependent methyltransferase